MTSHLRSHSQVLLLGQRYIFLEGSSHHFRAILKQQGITALFENSRVVFYSKNTLYLNISPLGHAQTDIETSGIYLMPLYVFFGIACQNILQGHTRFCEIVPFKEKERA